MTHNGHCCPWAKLRATASLASLHQEQGPTDQAIDMLSKAYRGFAEGFDTPDIRQAKTLLDELQAA
jgi:hypothetical protein